MTNIYTLMAFSVGFPKNIANCDLHVLVNHHDASNTVITRKIESNYRYQDYFEFKRIRLFINTVPLPSPPKNKTDGYKL